MREVPRNTWKAQNEETTWMQIDDAETYSLKFVQRMYQILALLDWQSAGSFPIRQLFRPDPSRLNGADFWKKKG